MFTALFNKKDLEQEVQKDMEGGINESTINIKQFNNKVEEIKSSTKDPENLVKYKLLNTAKRDGINIEGIDMDDKLLYYKKKAGLPLNEQELKKYNAKYKKFDDDNWGINIGGMRTSDMFDIGKNIPFIGGGVEKLEGPAKFVSDATNRAIAGTPMLVADTINFGIDSSQFLNPYTYLGGEGAEEINEDIDELQKEFRKGGKELEDGIINALGVDKNNVGASIGKAGLDIGALLFGTKKATEIGKKLDDVLNKYAPKAKDIINKITKKQSNKHTSQSKLVDRTTTKIAKAGAVGAVSGLYASKIHDGEMSSTDAGIGAIIEMGTRGIVSKPVVDLMKKGLRSTQNMAGSFFLGVSREALNALEDNPSGVLKLLKGDVDTNTFKKFIDKYVPGNVNKKIADYKSSLMKSMGDKAQPLQEQKYKVVAEMEENITNMNIDNIAKVRNAYDVAKTKAPFETSSLKELYKTISKTDDNFVGIKAKKVKELLKQDFKDTFEIDNLKDLGGAKNATMARAVQFKNNAREIIQDNVGARGKTLEQGIVQTLYKKVPGLQYADSVRAELEQPLKLLKKELYSGKIGEETVKKSIYNAIPKLRDNPQYIEQYADMFGKSSDELIEVVNNINKGIEIEKLSTKLSKTKDVKKWLDDIETNPEIANLSVVEILDKGTVSKLDDLLQRKGIKESVVITKGDKTFFDVSKMSRDDINLIYNDGFTKEANMFITAKQLGMDTTTGVPKFNVQSSEGSVGAIGRAISMAKPVFSLFGLMSKDAESWVKKMAEFEMSMKGGTNISTNLANNVINKISGKNKDLLTNNEIEFLGDFIKKTLYILPSLTE